MTEKRRLAGTFSRPSRVESVPGSSVFDAVTLAEAHDWGNTPLREYDLWLDRGRRSRRYFGDLPGRSVALRREGGAC